MLALLGRGVLVAAVVAVAGRAGIVAAQGGKGPGGTTARPSPPEIIIGKGVEGLPPAVADMRSEIMTAVERGDITELKRAMDLNELKPEVGAPAGREPVDHLRDVSAYGKGVSILVHLGRLLKGRWAAIPGGRDIENNRMYVWPHFAEVPLAGMTDADRAELRQLVGDAAADAIIASGKWQGWRLAIGADGVWHTLLDIKP